MIYDNLMQSIGDTPLVKVQEMVDDSSTEVFAKMEKFNPTGSVKDRAAFYMIEKAEQEGELSEGKTIVEASSGNTGLGLAFIGRYKGYDVKIVMPENMSSERKKILKTFGAEVITTPAEGNMEAAIKKAEELAEEPGNFMPDQFSNPANPRAHYETTAEEIIEDLPEITHFVAGMGTGGTLVGVSRKLREEKEDVEVVGVEPEPDHSVQGLKNMKSQLTPEIYDPSLIDEKINVSDGKALKTSRILARKEGLFVGMSSGAAMRGALEVAERTSSGRVVVLLADGGEKYLSTELFNK